ncbi:MAG: TraB/GumN family protein [Kofleriaceae bacterium]|nr:TraB/GumN family protein [Kofleriaceae bacterium]
MQGGRIALVVLLAVACGDRSEHGPEQAPKPTTPTGAASGDPWGAPPPARDEAPPNPTRPLEHPFVWVAEKDGHATTLLGTLHAGFDAKDRLPLWVWKRLENAKTLVVEADPLDPELSSWTMRAPGSPTLREELGEEYWAKLVDLMGRKQLAMNGLSSTAMVAAQISGYGNRVEATLAMDFALLGRAKKLDKAIVYLERAKAQGAMLTAQFSLEALKLLIDRHEDLPRINRAFFRAYEDGDAQTFDALGRESFSKQVPDYAAHQRLIAQLLTDRNRAWLPVIEELHAKGEAFIAVGALHLVGEGSVLDLLLERGYRIRRLYE